LDNFAVIKANRFTYSLAQGTPSGATVAADSGVFAWTPGEDQGPATHTLELMATDSSSPPLRATNRFAVIVGESNRAPVHSPIADRAVHAGSVVWQTNAANDVDLPTNTLTFTLDGSAPKGASLDPVSGVFSWPTSDAEVGTTNQFLVRVTDDGTPPLTALQAFKVVVEPRPAILGVARSGTNLVLSWRAIPGTTYAVQYKAALQDPAWLDLAPGLTVTTTIGSLLDAFGPEERFYRIRVAEP
jgi:hypothetical protein